MPEWPILIKKIPCITVGAEYHGSMHQSGRLPLKKYRALPWYLNTAVNVTNLKIVTEKSHFFYVGVFFLWPPTEMRSFLKVAADLRNCLRLSKYCTKSAASVRIRAVSILFFFRYFFLLFFWRSAGV